jgi:carboxyl-terminal processing protease
MKKSFIFTTLGIFLFILLCHQAPIALQTPQSNVFDKKIYEWSKVLAESFHVVNAKHYDPSDPEKAIIDVLKAFFKKLDPHSYFMDSKGYEDIIQSTKGELSGGIGIIIDNTKEPDDEFLRIIDTIPAGPADKEGIKAEDKIIEIDGEVVKGMTVDEAVSKLKGKRHTTVSVKIIRSDTTRILSFTLTRDIVKEPNALCYYFKDHQVYYLCLSMFTENSVAQLEQLLKKIQDQSTKGLILDLRNNTGGLLDAAIRIAELFLPKNSLVVITKGRDNKEMDRYTTKKDPIANGSVPIFVLVNNYTASAAEILTGCLQSYSEQLTRQGKGQHVFVTGSKTYGKGTWQEVIPTCNNCAIALTIGVYCLPDGTCIQGVGIKPDFEIQQKLPPSQETLWFNNMFGRESALKNAIKNDQQQANPLIKGSSLKQQQKKDAEKSWHEKKRDLIASDYQILSTLRLLEMLEMAKKAYPERTKTRHDALELLNTLYTPHDKAEIDEIKI